MAVGAVYQTVTRYFSIREYQWPAAKPPSYTRLVAPLLQGPNIP